jgi:hypothetical protein
LIRRTILPVLILVLLFLPFNTWARPKVHRHGITICSLIIWELTEGKISKKEAREISLAIARAGNKHFGKTTCGDMWLYMAIAYVESGFRNNLVNHLNCRGMFQIHAPSWARKFGVSYKDLLNKNVNADVGIRVFKYYLRLYKKLIPTLSAYNSDHPRAARRYARAVLGVRKRIKKRYEELYRSFNASSAIAFDNERGIIDPRQTRQSKDSVADTLAKGRAVDHPSRISVHPAI